jgi:hypothetical protein
MKMSSAVDGYSGKIQVGVGRTGAAPVLAQTSEAKQIKTGPSAHNYGRERRAKGNLFFYVYSVVPWTSTGNSQGCLGKNSTPCHPVCPGVPWERSRRRASPNDAFNDNVEHAVPGCLVGFRAEVRALSAAFEQHRQLSVAKLNRSARGRRPYKAPALQMHAVLNERVRTVTVH